MNIIGKKFGSLTVISLDEKRNEIIKEEKRKGLRKSTTKYYICKCDCGNTVSLQKQKIVNRKAQHCDKCGKIDFINYIGLKINNWHILDYDKKNHKFKCKCVCGTVKNVNSYNIINNQSKDCGCGRNKQNSKRMSIESLIGKKFGKLTVLENVGKNKYGKTIYKCKCECGNEINVLSNSLRTGHTLSCGCIISYQPSVINSYLKHLGYTTVLEKRVELQNKDISYLRFDIFVNELNLAIEYDGKPHFIPIDWAGKGIEWAITNLEESEKRDIIKDKYCYDNGIYLLRIPYTQKNNIKEIIDETINIILK